MKLQEKHSLARPPNTERTSWALRSFSACPSSQASDIMVPALQLTKEQKRISFHKNEDVQNIIFDNTK